mgnify:CR=1 FL=1
MKKQLIAFSLQRLGREDKKTGYGVICDDGDLLLRVKKGETRKQDRWKRVDSYKKHLFPVAGKPDEYSGYYTEYGIDTLIPSKNGSFDTRDTETTYYIWFKKMNK